MKMYRRISIGVKQIGKPNGMQNKDINKQVAQFSSKDVGAERKDIPRCLYDLSCRRT